MNKHNVNRKPHPERGFLTVLKWITPGKSRDVNARRKDRFNNLHMANRRHTLMAVNALIDTVHNTAEADGISPFVTQHIYLATAKEQ